MATWGVSFLGGVLAQRTDTFDIGSRSDYIDLGSTAFAYGPGTADGQVSVFYAGTRTLAAGAFEDIDLRAAAAGGLDDQSIFAAVKALFVRVPPGSASKLAIGGAPAAAWTGPLGGVVTLDGGCVFEFVHPGAGWPVTDATGDVLRFACVGAASLSYTLAIAGV
jgi:hypothetical protein